MFGPYRTHTPINTRYEDVVRRVKGALGLRSSPLLEEAASDREIFVNAFSFFARRISDLVTDWYVPFLVQEIRNAEHYEEALPAASLLAYSEKPGCIHTLAGLLRSSRPLDILVSIETLGDLVAFSPQGMARSMAVFHLENSIHRLAAEELDSALMLSMHGYPRPAYAPPPFQLSKRDEPTDHCLQGPSALPANLVQYAQARSRTQPGLSTSQARLSFSQACP